MGKKIDYKKVLQMFVSNDELRPVMNKPFKQSNHIIATDAWTLIAIPCKIYTEELKEEDWSKDMITLFLLQSTENNIKIKISDFFTQLKPEMIDEVLHVTCRECEGEGEIECNLGHYHTCGDCNGLGEIDSEPSGKKIANPDAIFKLQNNHFKYSFLKKAVLAFKELGIEDILYTSQGDYKSGIFIGNDIRIIIMPTIAEPKQNITELKFNYEVKA